jgi:hypothetical protein
MGDMGLIELGIINEAECGPKVVALLCLKIIKFVSLWCIKLANKGLFSAELPSVEKSAEITQVFTRREYQ